MMNILPANEIKRHGVTAIEKKLKKGPVHVLKHNQPLFVVLTEEEYMLLTSQKTNAPSALLTMIAKPATGKRSRKNIDTQLKKERASWD